MEDNIITHLPPPILFKATQHSQKYNKLVQSQSQQGVELGLEFRSSVPGSMLFLHVRLFAVCRTQPRLTVCKGGTKQAWGMMGSTSPPASEHHHPSLPVPDSARRELPLLTQEGTDVGLSPVLKCKGLLKQSPSTSPSNYCPSPDSLFRGQHKLQGSKGLIGLGKSDCIIIWVCGPMESGSPVARVCPRAWYI